MNVARAEDRAPWRHDPSADPGAKTEGGRHDAALSFPFGIGTKAANRPDLFRAFTLPYLPTPVSPFHAEPAHIRLVDNMPTGVCALALKQAVAFCKINSFFNEWSVYAVFHCP